MVQGTTSDAGKSTLVAGLCRVLAKKGHKVAPFKPQNMALNSAVTEDGGEIGRAQALQAVAAEQPLRIDFNPILLKPSSDRRAQVIVHGKALTTLEASEFWGKQGLNYKAKAMKAVLESYNRLTSEFDYVVVEGAGSPAEINLREGDIANMGFAEAADCPVIIIADIDKGGVFAHLVGTLALLSESEQARVKGFVINRFRGDISLLQSGLDWLEEYTGKPVLGVLPYLDGLHLDAEDAIPQHQIQKQPTKLKVVVIVLPRISNHTDFEPLRLHPDVEFNYARLTDDPNRYKADLIILPGSKNVIEDLRALKLSKWQAAIQKHLRYGGKLIGICGGYQMLGQDIADQFAVEGSITHETGLGYLPITTKLNPVKHLKNVTGHLILEQDKVEVKGYEIHCGESEYTESCQHAIELECDSSVKVDGVISSDNQTLATYVHGLFDKPESLKLLLKWTGLKTEQTIDIFEIREQQIERLADVLSKHCDIKQVYDLPA
ncbi:cobyric acid synthase [Shewanella sp. 202IG2-18]|nr:cobyric acid synthase [Parashewanella hymeniacidonis]